jgi:hypothetical protein
MKIKPVGAEFHADMELRAAFCNCANMPKTCMLQPGWHMCDQHTSFSQNQLNFYCLLLEKCENLLCCELT